jgi:hypothetical protein
LMQPGIVPGAMNTAAASPVRTLPNGYTAHSATANHATPDCGPAC